MIISTYFIRLWMIRYFSILGFKYTPLKKKSFPLSTFLSEFYYECFPLSLSELRDSHSFLLSSNLCDLNSVPFHSSGCIFHIFHVNYIMPLLLNLCKHPLYFLQFDFLSRIAPEKRKWWAEEMMLLCFLFAILITALWIWAH